MSRRYGRQQKRRDQARIDALECELKRAQEQERVTREALRIQRAEFQTLVREIEEVCPNSALLPPKELGFEPADNRVRLPIRPSFIRRMGPAINLYTRIEFPTIETVDLYELRATIERDLWRFQRTVHVTFDGPRYWECRYFLSEHAWRQMGKERGLHWMIETVMKTLMRAVQESAQERERSAK